MEIVNFLTGAVLLALARSIYYIRQFLLERLWTHYLWLEKYLISWWKFGQGQYNDYNIFKDACLSKLLERYTWETKGTKGFSLKSRAVQAQGNNDEVDLQQSQIAKDKQDVKAMIDLIESNWTNPFSSYQPLLSIFTGATALPEIKRDLSRAYLVRETAYQQFKNECLELEKPPMKFHHTLTKQKLKTSSDHNKTKKAKQSKGKETVLRADCNLFAEW